MGHDELAATFEEHRPRLRALAVRVLGSTTDADDAVQEAWVRLARYDGEPIDELGAWLTRVVGRICIDTLRRRTTRAESPLDGWVAEAVVTADDGPEDRAMTADSVALAMLVVLESLGPEERLAFVLHDVFAVPFAEIGPIVGRSTDAAKMLASRARRKVRAHPVPTGERSQGREVVDAFLAAAHDGDFEGLLRMLDPEIEWHHLTARGHRVLRGAAEVAEAVRGGRPARVTTRRVSVNGQPGFLAWGPSGTPLALMVCTVVGGRIVRADSLLDPARLARMQLPPAPVGRQ